jgi:hypothetical protein
VTALDEPVVLKGEKPVVVVAHVDDIKQSLVARGGGVRFGRPPPRRGARCTKKMDSSSFQIGKNNPLKSGRFCPLRDLQVQG